jgi:hypothetical protein
MYWPDAAAATPSEQVVDAGILRSHSTMLRQPHVILPGGQQNWTIQALILRVSDPVPRLTVCETFLPMGTSHGWYDLGMHQIPDDPLVFGADQTADYQQWRAAHRDTGLVAAYRYGAYARLHRAKCWHLDEPSKKLDPRHACSENRSSIENWARRQGTDAPTLILAGCCFSKRGSK